MVDGAQSQGRHTAAAWERFDIFGGLVMKKLLAIAGAVALVPGAASGAPFAFVPGDLVVSVYGQVDGSATNFTDNQASPILLQQLTTGGTLAGSLLLPQTSSMVNGVFQNPISGEYGSSSEEYLNLSGNGQSLTLMGYGVNAAIFNAGGAATYGNAALAQSTSVPGGSTTAVSRVVVQINADASVDTSTGLFYFANTNNPRAAYTYDGSSFYVSGQGVKGDTTQGVFLAQKGASSATPITTATDTRGVPAWPYQRRKRARSTPPASSMHWTNCSQVAAVPSHRSK